jgi:putative glycosyltransferase (TIGR04372 family)
VNLKSKLPPRFQKYASLGVFPKIILFPFALFAVTCFIIVRPVILIQVHKVKDWRIGHFATNTEITRLKTVEHNKNNRKKLITIYYFGSKVASNISLGEIWSQSLPSVRGHWGWLLNAITSKLANMNSSTDSTNIDLSGFLLTENKPILALKRSRRSEIDLIKNLCKGDSFVCLNVRDCAFMSATRTRDMSYHNYRDSDISTYVAAAEALAEMGYTVFRMGAIVREPLVSKHPRVVDYATNGMRTDFLDVFLGAHCSFCISTGSGWDSVPTIFRRPIMLVNHLPTFDTSTITLPIMIYPKTLSDKQTRNNLSLEEIRTKHVVNSRFSNEFADAGVEIRDLSSEELVEAVTEMAQRVEGTFVETPEQKEMQAKLKHILSTHPKLQPKPNCYPIRAEFASCFLSRYPNFLDGLD